MAADNYSDVVQALAQQIVGTCTKLLANNVQSMIRSANIDASQITGDTSLIVGGGGGTATSIDASDVIGLNTAIANAIAGSSIDVSQIVRFDENVGLVVARAQIDTAQISELQTYVADIADARIDNATIDTAKIRNLETEVARIANAAIDTATIDVANVDWANIDWANIKNSITGHAIITQGVGGQLYITDLAVTEANMVSLTVGELVVKGQDGKFYSVTVDENNQVVATQKLVATGDLADQAVNNDKIANQTINGDTKMIEGSITARTLNVQDIFANTAIIKELIAANIDVDTLFAREATIAKINTMEIASGSNLQLSVQNEAQNTFINMSNDTIASKVMNSQQFTTSYATKTEIDNLVGYRLEIVSTSDVLSDDIPTTTLSAEVYHGSQDVTDTLAASRFNWKRVTNLPSADENWAAEHRGMKSITLGKADVFYSATYYCELE